MRELSDTHIKAVVELCWLCGPEPLTRLDDQWVVFWGGPDPDNFAGRETYDDQAGAEEMLQWVRGSGVARRSMYAGPWEVTSHAPTG